MKTLECTFMCSRIDLTDPDHEFSFPLDTKDSTLTGENEDEFPHQNKPTPTRSSDTYYVEAKQSMVLRVAQIPLWMHGVLVVLERNEARIVLFNPLYFAFLLMCLADLEVLLVNGYVS
jgi:hypothetical protein